MYGFLQRNRTNRTYRDTQKEIYYERLAYMIMEAEKAHDLPSAGWRPRKAGGVVPVESQRPETQDC